MEYDPESERLAAQPRAPGAMCVLQTPGESVAKQNYHQARKQRELARKARQQAKQERRSAQPLAPDASAADNLAQTPSAGAPPVSGGDGA